MTKSGFLFLLILSFASFSSYGQEAEAKTVVVKTRCVSSLEEPGNPLFVIFVGDLTGEFEDKDIRGINPDHIKEMKVLKTPDAVKEYGEAAKNGAILIWLKDEALNQLPKAMVKGLSKMKSADLSPL